VKIASDAATPMDYDEPTIIDGDSVESHQCGSNNMMEGKLHKFKNDSKNE
jgi:hypothetical protein